ncbi:MAG: CopD family protein [Candidatus Sericytochromatia bacterium]
MYLYFKAFHIIFMVTWFAGLFYQFRLYVYHVESTEQVVREQLKIMERRLYKFTTPLMLLNLIFGTITAYMYTQGSLEIFAEAHWLHIKIFLVLCLIAYHIYNGIILKQLKEDRCKLTPKQCRLLNEVPVPFLFLIVLLASLKSALIG